MNGSSQTLYKVILFPKGALTSFGVMCKGIAHSIQSRLLYLPAKFQGLETNKT